jgi:diaminopimelate epimerase
MIEFYKMSGSGNDFILIDNRRSELNVPDLNGFINRVCARKGSVGADGLILIEKSATRDFRWRFFNADGSEVDMCGNGGRCAARFAYIKGIAPQQMSFETQAGVIDAEVDGDTVKLRLTDPTQLTTNQRITIDDIPFDVDSVNTGVPHVVHFTSYLDEFDVIHIGRAIRYHKEFKPAGTNANFVEVIDDRTLRIRTYERGVEDETLACGTGSVAAALIAAEKNMVVSPVNVIVRSGETLRIHFEKTVNGFEQIYLEGKANVVYEGRLWEEAYT